MNYLKNVQIQASALLSHRLLQALCIYSETLSFDALIIAIRNVEVVAVVDISSIIGPMKHLASEILDFAYAVIGKIQIEFFAVKDFYTHYLYFEQTNLDEQGKLKNGL